MKINAFFIFIFSIIFLKSCGLPGPMETSVTLPTADSMISYLADSDGSDFNSNFYILNLQGYSPDNQKYFQKTFTSESKSEKLSQMNLPNGNWYFYGTAYHYTKSLSMNDYSINSVKCYFQNTSLDGLSKEIVLNIEGSILQSNNEVRQCRYSED